jgi:hypothetical protein
MQALRAAKALRKKMGFQAPPEIPKERSHESEDKSAENQSSGCRRSLNHCHKSVRHRNSGSGNNKLMGFLFCL